MFESRADNNSNIRLCIIDDISPDTFEFLREYFYNLDPKMNNFNAVEIVYASTKYLLPSLQHPCSKFINGLYDTQTGTNKLDIYSCWLPMMVQLYNIGFHDMSISLLNKSLHLYQDAKTAMEQQGFLDLPLHIFKVLVSSDEFGGDEYYIYTKIIQWVQYQIKKKSDKQEEEKQQDQVSERMEKLMHNFKYAIRWPLIPLTYYKNNQCGQYCLNKDELKLIDGLLTNPEQDLMNDYKYYDKFKCYYRDFNKNQNDEECFSFKYYESEKIKNDNMMILQFVFVDLDFNNPERNRALKSPTFYGCIIDKTSTMNDFRKYCSKRFDIINNDYQNVFICLILEGKIFHVFNIKDKMTDLDTNKYLICVYYSPLIIIRSIKVEMDDSEDDNHINKQIIDHQQNDFYPFSETIDGWNYRWNYIDDIEKRKQNDGNDENKETKIKPKKKKQHLLSIVHVDPQHSENLKPLCGIPILLNLFSETKINLFTLQKHYLSNIAKIIMDDELYESIIKSNVHSIKFIDDDIKRYFNIIVRRQFIYYTALDTESILKLNKSDTQNLLCLKFEPDQIHNFKKSFTHSIKYCRKHISAPPTSKQWKLSQDYTEKKMIRVFRTKQTMKLKSKPIQNDAMDKQ